tara:strand:+ start:439 stop:1170 length:732 start_codon:yes stop_codon:yes gene_type:complete
VLIIIQAVISVRVASIVYFCVPLLLIFACQYSGIDQYLSAKFYVYTDGWQTKNSWWLDTVAHKGGRYLVIILILLMLSLTFVSYWKGFGYPWQRKVGVYLCVSTLAAISTVSLLKGVTTLPCPWDITGLGGQGEYVYLTDIFSTHLAIGHCFPAGHASGGYAFFSLYFAANVWRAKTPCRVKANLWFLPGMLLGLCFGLAQQLRGAHFMSHDIASALVCWCVCAFILKLLFDHEKRSVLGETG